MSARAARSRSAVRFCRAQALGSAEPTLVPEQWYAPASAHLVAPVARDDGKRARCAYRAKRPRDAVERVELALTEAARVAEAAQQVPRRHCVAAGRRRPGVGLLRARSGAQAAAVRACAQFHAPKSRTGRACVCASARPRAYAQAASTCAKCGSGTAAAPQCARRGPPAARPGASGVEMAPLLHDRASLSLAVEALGEGGAPGGPAGNAPSAVDARAAVFKPDGARFTHASTTLKLFERAMYAIALSARARRRGRSAVCARHPLAHAHGVGRSPHPRCAALTRAPSLPLVWVLLQHPQTHPRLQWRMGRTRRDSCGGDQRDGA